MSRSDIWKFGFTEKPRREVLKEIAGKTSRKHIVEMLADDHLDAIGRSVLEEEIKIRDKNN